MANFMKKKAGHNSDIDRIVHRVWSQVEHDPLMTSNPDLHTAMVNYESLDQKQSVRAQESKQQIEQMIDSLVTLEGLCAEYRAPTQSQREAAFYGAVLTSDISASLNMPIISAPVDTPNTTYIPADEGLSTRPSMEAYDERSLNVITTYTTTYNYLAARQDEFGEALFPTVIVPPDQPGYQISIRIVNVIDELKRSVSGKVTPFSEQNILWGLMNHEVLENQTIKVVPVYRESEHAEENSTANFVDKNTVAPYSVVICGETVQTAPLKIGAKMDLIALSQTKALLDTGLMDQTDALDSAVHLKAIYVKFGDDVVRFETMHMSQSLFLQNRNNNYRTMMLNFTTDALHLTPDTPNYAKSAVKGALTEANLVKLVATRKTDKQTQKVTDPGWSVRLGASISGNLHLEHGTLQLSSGSMSLESVMDGEGNLLALEGEGVNPDVTALAKAVEAAEVIGYDIDARRTNTNRRQLGKIIKTDFWNQQMAIPLQSPFSTQRPSMAGDVNDTSDLASLVVATRIRTSNKAVTALLSYRDTLKEIVNNRDRYNQVPDIAGVARFIVRPVYVEDQIDVEDATNSLKSSEKMLDISATIVNKLRDTAYRMYRDSGYKAASQALNSGAEVKPTVIIATDPVIHQYLMINGETRLMGDAFEYKIVSTLDNRVKDKIFMTFGNFGRNEGQPDPLHFGTMAWKPEMTIVIPTHRNGQNSKELTVTPSFRHIMNCPILSYFEVHGIPELVEGRVPMDVNVKK